MLIKLTYVHRFEVLDVLGADTVCVAVILPADTAKMDEIFILY